MNRFVAPTCARRALSVPRARDAFGRHPKRDTCVAHEVGAALAEPLVVTACPPNVGMAFDAHLLPFRMLPLELDNRAQNRKRTVSDADALDIEEHPLFQDDTIVDELDE